MCSGNAARNDGSISSASSSTRSDDDRWAALPSAAAASACGVDETPAPLAMEAWSTASTVCAAEGEAASVMLSPSVTVVLPDGAEPEVFTDEVSPVESDDTGDMMCIVGERKAVSSTAPGSCTPGVPECCCCGGFVGVDMDKLGWTPLAGILDASCADDALPVELVKV